MVEQSFKCLIIRSLFIWQQEKKEFIINELINLFVLTRTHLLFSLHIYVTFNNIIPYKQHEIVSMHQKVL